LRSAPIPGTAAPGDAAEERAQRGVTWRAVLLALALLILLSLAAFWAELVWYRTYDVNAGCPAMGPITSLFLLTALMSLPGLRRVGLSRGELLTVFCVVIAGSPLVSHGILFWMLPKVIAFYHQAQIHPEWTTSFISVVPTWFAPTDPAAIEGFFEGKAAVPWSLWWTPLAAWSGFLLCLFLATLCAVIIVQRQWITNERLSFPIAQIPLEMVQDSERGRAGRLSGAWMFWIGVLVAFLLNFLNGLSRRLPAVPAIPLGPVPLMQWQKVGPLAGLGEIDLVLYPFMIAIAYLIPKELSFSAWFFWLVRMALTVGAIAAGATPQRPEEWYGASFPAPYFQGGGAAFALLLWVFWIARHHFARAARLAVKGGADPVDRHEPLPYRWAFLGFIVSFGLMVCFCLAAGCRPVFAVVLIGLIVGYYLLMARVRAETGIGFIPFPLEIQDGLTSILGSKAFTSREIVTMISTRWTFFPGFGQSAEVITANALENYKIADAAKINSRRLTLAVIAGFVVTLIFGLYLLLTNIYRQGYFGLGMGSSYNWPSWQTRNDGGRIFEYLSNPAGPELNGILAFSAGAAVAVVLGLFRLRFWWWPFHPVGYIAANVWGIQENYMPFFLGWALKVLVVRYGGLRLYRATVPLAIGLIVGDQLNSLVWTVVALVTKGQV